MTAIGEVFLVALGDEARRLSGPHLASLSERVSRQTATGVFYRAGCRAGRWAALARPMVGASAVVTRDDTDVPFQVELSATTDDAGRPVLHTTRRFRFAGGEQTLLDAVSPTGRQGELRSLLGARKRVEVIMHGTVTDDGALALTSRSVALRLGRLRVPLPRGLRPKIQVRDGWDAEHARRTIDMTARHPLAGTLLEYRGWFVPRPGRTTAAGGAQYE